ncbi:MAG: hypothetical protein B6D56_05195 [Candidatus Omnitrophica bacterium 4484_70.1]|nr:MAG: hypothetical protein B6D56_05195 [Candidatus Omnitrophica bacterium 4484_70.1]
MRESLAIKVGKFQNNYKLIFILLIFFLLDVIKPLGFSLNTEFVMLGIIFLSINFSFPFSLFTSFAFGILRDIFSPLFPNFSLQLVLLSLFIKYLDRHLPPHPLSDISKAGFAILGYVAINSLLRQKLSLIFSISFFLHSFVCFFLIKYFLERWMFNLSGR